MRDETVEDIAHVLHKDNDLIESLRAENERLREAIRTHQDRWHAQFSGDVPSRDRLLWEALNDHQRVPDTENDT